MITAALLKNKKPVSSQLLTSFLFYHDIKQNQNRNVRYNSGARTLLMLTDALIIS